MDRFLAIEAFVRVAETRSFAEAARQMRLSRSVLTERVQQLEAFVGAPLFVRNTRSVRLSELGQTFLRDCVELVGRTNEVVNQISRFVFENGSLDRASEKVLLKIPVQREECCHSAGCLRYGEDGYLYLSTGDNTNPTELTAIFAHEVAHLRSSDLLWLAAMHPVVAGVAIKGVCAVSA